MGGPVYLLQSSFNAGELSPKMAGQAEFKKYKSGCQILENFIPLPQGPAQSRPGLLYVATAPVANVCCVRPFVSSDTAAYVLEFGGLYLRFYKNQAQIQSGGVPYELVTPYAAADVMDLQFSQLNDVVYIWHNNYPPMKLSRYGDASWTLTVVLWNDGPYLNASLLGGVQLQCSAGYGTGVTVTAQNRGVIGSFDSSIFTAAANQAALTPTYPYAAFRFKTGANTGELLSYQMQLTGASTHGGNVGSASLYTDVSGSPGAPVTGGAATNTESLTTIGELNWVFNNPLLAANTWYWICFSAGTADTAISFACVTTAAGFGSGVSGSGFTSITDSMGKEFLATAFYQPTGAASVFQAGHVGSVWRIQHSGGAVIETFASAIYGAQLELLGEFIVDISVTEDWVGTLFLELSYDTVNWFMAAEFTTSTKQDFYENRLGVWYRIRCDVRTAGTANCIVCQIENWGSFQITAVTSPNVAVVDVLSIILLPTTWTPFWLEAAWSYVRGFPGCGCFRGGRLYAANTPYQPTTIWGTWVGDLENMSPGNTDDAAVVFPITDFTNPIQWMMSSTDFLGGTMGEEAQLAAAGTAISGSNPLNVNVPSTHGSQPGTMPLKVGTGLFFVQQGGMRLRLMAFVFMTNSYQAEDVSRYADHITGPGVIDMAYQKEPYQVMWCVRSDGVLAGLTYYPEEEVIGWNRFVTAGQILSVACIPSVSGPTSGRTELWATVARTINGSLVYTIELLADFEYPQRLRLGYTGPPAQSLYTCLDCAIVQTLETPQSVITGLDFFDGQIVGVQGDGAPQAQQTVAGGQITIDPPALHVVVGLPYTCTLKTMDLEGGAQNGTSQARVREFQRVGMRVLNSFTGGVQIGLDENNLMPLSNWFADSTQADSPPPLYTGDVDPGGWPANSEKKATVCIVQDQPAPLCVVGLYPVLTVNES